MSTKNKAKRTNKQGGTAKRAGAAVTTRGAKQARTPTRTGGGSTGKSGAQAAATTKSNGGPTKAPPVIVKPGEGGRGNRYQVFGHPVTAILRWMGTRGFSAVQAAAALKALGVEPSMTTVKIQVSGKANRGAIPPLTDRDAKALLKFKA